MIFKESQKMSTPFETIQRQSAPYLVFGSNSEPLSWIHGTLLRLRLKSTFIRITARGLQYYTRNDFMIDDAAWDRVTCLPSATALCEEDSTARMLYFDTGEVDVPDDWALLMQTKNGFLERFPNGTSCSGSDTGRTLRICDVWYELSLCDLLDRNLDIILRPRDNTLYWRVNSMPTWEYFGIAFVAIYLIASLSHNLVHVLTDAVVSEKERSRRSVTMTVQLVVVSVVLAYCLVYYVYSMFSCTDCAGTHILTTSDRVLTAHLLFIGIMDTFFLWQFRVHVTLNHAGNISLITSCLILLLVRVYETTDTPYLTVLCCFFGARSIYKLCSVITEHPSRMERVMLIFDAFVFSSLLGNGLWQNAENNSRAVFVQGQVLIISSIAGIFLFGYKTLKELEVAPTLTV
jgi:hypothetical protein